MTGKVEKITYSCPCGKVAEERTGSVGNMNLVQKICVECGRLMKRTIHTVAGEEYDFRF